MHDCGGKSCYPAFLFYYGKIQVSLIGVNGTEYAIIWPAICRAECMGSALGAVAGFIAVNGFYGFYGFQLFQKEVNRFGCIFYISAFIEKFIMLCK